MRSLQRLFPGAGLWIALAVSTAPADETTDKQKKVAAENLKKAEVDKSEVVETESLIVHTTLPAPRAKAVASLLQKTYKVARKGLQLEEKEEPWKGKLTVYHLPDRKSYATFLRAVGGDRPENPYYVSVRGDEPYVVSGPDLSAKSTDADVAAQLSPAVAVALLMSKAGASTPVPTWVRNGFGQAATLRADGPNGKRFPAYKSQARAAVLKGGGGKPTPVADVWGSERSDVELIQTALIDYMAFGPGAANFPRFVTGLRADENGDTPPIAMVLESAGWKAPALEVAWWKWVQGGMPATKGPAK